MRLIDADALQEPVVELLDLAIKRVEDTPNDSPCYRMYVAQENERSRFIDLIDNATTVEPDMEFAKWVTEMIFGNNEVEDFDFELFSELACRKLEKLGLVKKTESEWIKERGAD